MTFAAAAGTRRHLGSTIGALPFVPVAFFGMPLGLLALGNAWRAAGHLWQLPLQVGETIVVAGVGVWIVLLGLTVAKWIIHPDAAKAEIEHPVQFAFYSLIGVTAILAAAAVLPYVRPLAVGIYAAAASFVLAFAVWSSGLLWTGGRDAGLSLPMLYIPTVAAGFAAATGAAVLGWNELAQLAFGAGLLSWVALEATILGRLLSGPPLVPALRPLLGIQLAPPTVGGVTALAVYGPAAAHLSTALLGYALLQALVLARLFPWIREKGFTPTLWSFAFGAAALGTLPLRLAAQDPTPIISGLAVVLFGLANLVICSLVIATLRLALSRREPLR